MTDDLQHGGALAWFKGFATVAAATLASLIAFFTVGQQLFGTLATVQGAERNLGLVVEQIRQLDQRVQELTSLLDRLARLHEAHTSVNEIHQTVGEKFADREQWFTAKSMLINDRIEATMKAHEAGGQPHPGGLKIMERLELRIERQDGRIATIEQVVGRLEERIRSLEKLQVRTLEKLSDE